MSDKPGFVAALDQSGGSTPGALRLYGIPDSAYNGDDEMFALMHEMRVRVMTAPAFTGEKIIATILFERTMDGTARRYPVPTFLWKDRGIVPFLKVDKGLEDERDGVNLMKPIPGLDALLARAAGLGVYGTKMRSTIRLASINGIAAIVDQQFELAAQIADRGLLPILEPEVLIKEPRQGGGGSDTAGGARPSTRRAPGASPGDVEADDSGRAEPVRASNSARRRGPRRGTLRRLFTR